MKEQIQTAQTVVPCRNLDQTLEFFTETLGFRLNMIFPADAPATAVISGYGTTLRLEESSELQPVALRLLGDFAAPVRFLSFENIKLIFENSDAPAILPAKPDELVISTLGDENVWHPGRAGMQYRDLIPSRLGGHFIASHIRIEKGGEVPDYVHFHKIRFQMIYCLAGWARLVYEDQGAPFVMRAGDCVLQPPEIRHRVLECSDAFEVLEIGSPAVHETWVDQRMELPNDKFNPERIFSEQRFVHHRARHGVWAASEVENIESCDTGIAEATKGLAKVDVLRALADTSFSINHPDEFLFFFVRQGRLQLTGREGESHNLEKGSCGTLPKDSDYFVEAQKDLELIRVSLP